MCVLLCSDPCDVMARYSVPVVVLRWMLEYFGCHLFHVADTTVWCSCKGSYCCGRDTVEGRS